MEKKNIVIGAVCLILGLAVGWYVWHLPASKPGGIGTSARLEDMLPGILYNDGAYTERSFWSTASSTFSGILNVSGNANFLSGFALGSTSPSGGDLVVDAKTGTSTLRLHAGAAGKGACIEFASATTSLNYRMYLGDTIPADSATRVGPFVVEQGSCE